MTMLMEESIQVALVSPPYTVMPLASLCTSWVTTWDFWPTNTSVLSYSRKTASMPKKPTPKKKNSRKTSSIDKCATPLQKNFIVYSDRKRRHISKANKLAIREKNLAGNLTFKNRITRAKWAKHLNEESPVVAFDYPLAPLVSDSATKTTTGSYRLQEDREDLFLLFSLFSHENRKRTQSGAIRGHWG